MDSGRVLLWLVAGVLGAAELAGQTRPGAVGKHGGAGIAGIVRDASTGAPIPDAIVWVQETPVFIGPRFSMSDQNGQYRFEQLPAGRYVVQAEKAGYVDGAYGTRRTGAVFGTPIDVNGAQYVDSVNISMWREANITGRVRDDSGAAVVGVSVRALRIGMAGSRQVVVSVVSTTTDDRGDYLLASVAPGDYVVSVPVTTTTYATTLTEGRTRQETMTWRDGDSVVRTTVPQPGSPDTLTFGDSLVQVPAAVPIPPPADGRFFACLPAFYPTASVLPGSTHLHVEAAKPYGGIDLTLRPVPGRRVSGVVTSPAEAVGSARLKLALSTPGGLGDLRDFEIATTVSAATGAFTFVGVPPGAYTLNADTSPLGPTEFWATARIDVDDADLEHLVVPLHRTVSIHGAIAWEGDSAPSQPLTFAVESAAASSPRLSTRGQDDGQGHFTVDRLVAGRYFVKPAAPAGWIVKSATLEGVDVTDAPISVGTQDIQDLRFVMTRVSSELRGQVRAEFGRPVVGATVLVFPAEPARRKEFGQLAQRFKTAVVDDRGSYSVGQLPAGDYLAVALADSVPFDWQDPDLLARLAGQGTRVTLAQGATATQGLSLRSFK